MKVLIKYGLTIFWIMDILNMPFMRMFDTTYPLNGAFWLLMLLITEFLDWEE